jgi:hypothetical protein
MPRKQRLKRKRAAAASLGDKPAQRPPSGFFGDVFDRNHLERALVVSNKVQLNDVALIVRVVAIIDGGLIKIIDGLSSNRRLLNCCVAA